MVVFLFREGCEVFLVRLSSTKCTNKMSVCVPRIVIFTSTSTITATVTASLTVTVTVPRRTHGELHNYWSHLCGEMA